MHSPRCLSGGEALTSVYSTTCRTLTTLLLLGGGGSCMGSCQAANCWRQSLLLWGFSLVVVGLPVCSDCAESALTIMPTLSGSSHTCGVTASGAMYLASCRFCSSCDQAIRFGVVTQQPCSLLTSHKMSTRHWFPNSDVMAWLVSPTAVEPTVYCLMHATICSLGVIAYGASC